jgi:steroid 5-alpha reductase family enzyme
VIVSWFLRNVTGAKRLERTLSQRDGCDAYAARVPSFVPLLPRR